MMIIWALGRVNIKSLFAPISGNWNTSPCLVPVLVAMCTGVCVFWVYPSLPCMQLTRRMGALGSGSAVWRTNFVLGE